MDITLPTDVETRHFADAGLLRPDSVRRHYRQNRYGVEECFLNEAIYIRKQGFIGEYFVDYEVHFDGNADDDFTARFRYFAGKAARGYGTYLVAGNERLYTEYVQGTSAATTTIQRNGKVVYKRTTPIEKK